MNVRCPYCVENSAFKLMHAHNGHFLCSKCGHETDPRFSEFECNCLKCRELNKTRVFPAQW